MKKEAVEQPAHYNTRGYPCIDFIEHFECNIANALKYIWRAGEKNDYIEDLEKARWYARREARRLRLDYESMPKRAIELVQLAKRVDTSDGNLGVLLRASLDIVVRRISPESMEIVAEAITEEIDRETRERIAKAIDNEP